MDMRLKHGDTTVKERCSFNSDAIINPFSRIRISKLRASQSMHRLQQVVIRSRQLGILGELMLEVLGHDGLHKFLMDFDHTFEEQTFINLLRLVRKRIGLKKTIEYVFNVPEFPQDLLLEICLNTLTEKHASVYYGTLLTAILKPVELIKTLNLDQIVDAVCYTVQNNGCSVKEIYRRLALTIKPNIEDVAPIFHSIKYVNPRGESFKLIPAQKAETCQFVRNMIKPIAIELLGDKSEVAMATDNAKGELIASPKTLSISEKVLLYEIRDVLDDESCFDSLLDIMIKKSSAEQLQNYIDNLDYDPNNEQNEEADQVDKMDEDEQ